MALPKITSPLFQIKMPSTGKELTTRPFLVKEEKILLMAQQSGSDKDIVLAIKQILNNCIQDADFNPDHLTTFDIEYMFLKLRAKSVNNKVKLFYIDNEDEKQYEFEVNLDDVEIEMPKEDFTKIKITDDVGIIMRYPTVNTIQEIPEGLTYAELQEVMIEKCINKVYDADGVYSADDTTSEELVEFLDSLPVESYQKVKNFFDSIPTLKYTIKYKNSLGHDREIELSSLKDFFTWG